MKKFAFLLFFIVSVQYLFPQQPGKLDSLFLSRDSTAVLDSLLKDFDSFLDSLVTPKSFFSVSAGVGTGIFSFDNKNSVQLSSQKKMIFSPMVAYFHKSGLGLSASAYIIGDQGNINVYQYAFSPSYDLIKRKFSTGISYTHYLNKDSLNFYTTPIRNELFAYFTYKKWWLRPSVSVSYGWGSKAEYQQTRLLRYARLLARLNRYYVTVKNEESVQDFSVTLSVRKNFDWYDVFLAGDNITFTPVLLLNSGTQNFGFNTSYTYNFSVVRANSLPSNQNIAASTQFAPQSASLALRGSYLKSRFILQPQILFDYYLQESDDRFNTVFSISAGITF